jgi:hypothetical protein
MARESEVAVAGVTEEDDRSPQTVDRILVGVCGAIWLVLLAVTVIAVVALVDLGRGHTLAGEGKQTPWVLYSVIAVSAVIIVGAIPLLIRARRAAMAEPVLPPDDAAVKAAAAAPQTPARAPVRLAEAPTEKLKVFGATVDPYEPYQPAFAQSSASRRGDLLLPATQLDRLWLRGTATLMSAIGLALIGVSLATYLLAAANETGAWVALGVAAVVTVAMPVIPVFYLRQLRAALDEAQAPE